MVKRGPVERVTVEHNDKTSWVAEHRSCGCVVAWGPLLRLWFDRECDTHLAEQQQERAQRRWWKWAGIR